MFRDLTIMAIAVIMLWWQNRSPNSEDHRRVRVNVKHEDNLDVEVSLTMHARKLLIVRAFIAYCASFLLNWSLTMTNFSLVVILT